jgi:para-aminobenzoate synthetase component 1
MDSDKPSVSGSDSFRLEMTPVPFERYREAFNSVMQHLRRGDTYLINLTMPTVIEVNLSPADIYSRARAPYRLLVNGRFVCFSPETFVTIHDGIIRSYPMKGTIDASVPEAEKKIMSDEKEIAEHNTIVDLIRNDLSMVADEVRVKRYRYIYRVDTNRGALLQVSSEITGRLPEGRRGEIGTIMSALLPAGSVTGAPKEKTVEILKAIEGYERGFYTGVFGYFNGRDLDSGVMIRFIEEDEGLLIYKSGGGITAMSNVKLEYEELINKVYVPFT